MVSAGFSDGNRADFYLDGRLVGMNGYSDRRGANVVVIDPNTGQVTSRQTYDIWGDPQGANPALAMDLEAVPQGHIVLVANKDSGMENLDTTAINALRRVGATIAGPLGVREGYALIGVKGGPAWAESQGPSCEAEWGIPCAVAFPPPPAPLPPAPAPMGQPQMPPFPGQPAAPQPGFGGAGVAPPQPRPPSTPPPGPPPIDVQPSEPRRAPKLSVDPKGGVTFEGDAEEDDEGRSWQEVVIMLDRLQEKIKAKRLAGLKGN